MDKTEAGLVDLAMRDENEQLKAEVALLKRDVAHMKAELESDAEMMVVAGHTIKALKSELEAARAGITPQMIGSAH